MNVYVLRTLKVLLVSVSTGVISTFISGHYEVKLLVVVPSSCAFIIKSGFPFVWLEWGFIESRGSFWYINWSAFMLDTLLFSMVVFLPSIMYFAVRKHVGMKVMMNDWLLRNGVKRILPISIWIYVFAAYSLIQSIPKPIYTPHRRLIVTPTELALGTLLAMGLLSGVGILINVNWTGSSEKEQKCSGK